MIRSLVELIRSARIHILARLGFAWIVIVMRVNTSLFVWMMACRSSCDIPPTTVAGQVSARYCIPTQTGRARQALWFDQGYRLVVLLVLILCLGALSHDAFAEDSAECCSPSASHSITNQPQTARESPQDNIALLSSAPLKRDIKGGETQSFKASIAAGQYVRLLIEQRGIILRVTLFDSRHNRIAEMDSPSGAHGPIYLSLITNEAADYVVEVGSTESWANPGSFEILIGELRQATPADKETIAAETNFAEARQLAAKATAESRRVALDRFRESLRIWDHVGEAHWRATTLFAIGSVHRGLADYQQAAKYYSESLKVNLTAEQKERDWRLIASAWNDLGLTAADLGDQKTAFESLQTALDAYRAHHDRRGEASALNNIGYTYHKLGRYRDAVRYFEESLPLRRAENDQLREFNVINNIGAMYDALGEPEKALEACAQTLQIWRFLYEKGQLTDPDRLAGALNNTAAVLERMGEWQKSLDSYEESLAISRKSGNAQRQASTLNNLGTVYQQWGDAVRARSYYDEALDLIRSKVKDPKAEANVLTQIGGLLMAEGKLTKALEYLNTARSMPQTPQREAEVLNYIAMIRVLEGKPAEALKLHEEALERVTRLRDSRGEAVTRIKRAQAYVKLGKFSLALEDLTASLSWSRSVKDRPGEGLALRGLAEIKGELNQLTDALRFSDEATQIIEPLRTRLSNYQLRTSYFATQHNLYELNIELNMRLYEQTRDPLRLATALHASERSRARSLLDSLTDVRANITEGANPGLLRREKEIERKIRAKSEAQTQLLSARHNTDEATTVANDLTKLIDESERIRHLIRAENPKYAFLTQPEILDLPRIQQLLDPNSILIEYFLGDSRSYVWAVTPNSIEGFELPPRMEIDAAATKLSTALTERNRTVKNETVQAWQRRITQADVDSDKAAAALSEMILNPVAALLGNKRLVIVADGALQLVSFAALPVPTTTKPSTATSTRFAGSRAARRANLRRLSDGHEVVYEPSASVLALQRHELEYRAPAPYAVAVLAHPVFDADDPRVSDAIARSKRGAGAAPEPKDIPPTSQKPTEVTSSARTNLRTALDDLGLTEFRALPHSKKEANSIVKAAGQDRSKIALDFDANRAFAMSPELSQYRRIHFATHSFADFAHPELSGIVLSMVDERGQPRDGQLRLHDIYNLNLPADLVVLSACQTAVGKQIRGEGLIALTRGFMYAGAQRVVASLWKVDDAATADLMAEFYDQMLTKKLTPAAALRAAQRKISRYPARRSPYFWAGFVLQGEWK